MAHKLTEQEQAAVVTLAKRLGKELPAASRSYAGGIASGLVRLRSPQVTRDELTALLAKYSARQETVDALVKLGVLSPVPGGSAGEKNAEAFTLNVAAGQTVPDTRTPAADQPATAGRSRAIAKTERPKPPARRESPKRDTRSLSHLDTIRKQTPELNDVRRQIIGLDPRLWINGWLLSTPDAFTHYERELRALDEALSGSALLGDGSLSCRELSYRVFGDEKFLALDSDGRKLLHLMGLTDVVCCRPQVKLELLHHIPKHHRHLRLVVSENLDPWINMRNAMFLDGRKRLLGEKVHGVVFGNGYLVDDPHKLPDLLEAQHAEDVCVLYWGDLDRAGLQILAKLAEMADGHFEVRPFTAAYRLMLQRAMTRFPDPLDNEETDQAGVPLRGLDLLEGELKPREAAYLREVLDNARLIPQEILTAADL
ncbi:Wadjet anti-phage system protein JetD domain-containing protein [Olsenella profusa]|uniref:Wadjet anti-phage system protein JetD domain-containing protein n=1 Tax=Olsenella profusa TaxID=138595 RepID=UPI001EF4FCE3|nr:Wadjet anti-phage system protein JetD domain-containing protein [Olsenella profusa]